MTEQKRILDIGCGKKKNPGVIGLDVRPLPGVDIVSDAFKYFLPFRSAIFDEVRCFHVLEHADDLLHVMEEIHRVLREDGLLHLIVPHGGTLRFLGDPTHKTAITCSTFNYFMPGYDYNFYSNARFEIEHIQLEVDEAKKNTLRWKIARWLWKKRMWQMERLLVFLRIDFALEVKLKKLSRGSA